MNRQGLHIFTPMWQDGTRAEWYLSEEDIRKLERGHRWSATVTNQDTGRAYRVRGASCGLPHCMCDAKVIREVAGEGYKL